MRTENNEFKESILVLFSVNLAAFVKVCLAKEYQSLGLRAVEFRG